MNRSRNRIAGIAINCFTVLAVAWSATAAPLQLELSEIVPLLESGRPKADATNGPSVTERPGFTRTHEGYLQSLSAAPGMEFPVTPLLTLTASSSAAGSPAPAALPAPAERIARQFLQQHGRLFGVRSAAVDFQMRLHQSIPGRHAVRLTQTYRGVPVFGGELVVQVTDGGGVEYVAGNFERDTAGLDADPSATTPRLTADEAAAAARAHEAPRAAGQPLAVTPPQLSLFAPTLLHMSGRTRLVWQMEVWSADHETVGRRVFIDAATGESVDGIALVHEALIRQISDAANTTNTDMVVRKEGGAPSAITDANQAYDYLGDTYDFYHSHFGRDSLDGTGIVLRGVVRYCSADKPCPLRNAFWNGAEMRFGTGFAVDDVTAHELTHGVTGYTSQLIYKNESGAINESMSDVFGEFVDLTNHRGSDSDSDRWLLGEDLPLDPNEFTYALRSMKDPHKYPLQSTGSPDWLGDSRYRPAVDQGTEDNDQGGVHYNSGVNNKLCYLLTDGDTFRERTVHGMGINAVAALYYEVNVHLLTASSGWTDLANAMKRAAINLGWDTPARYNLDVALAAAGIGPDLPQLYVDENRSGACVETGDSYCSFLFDGGPAGTLAKGVELLGNTAHGSLLLRGTAHTSRITGNVSIRAWESSARIVAP